MFRLPTHASVDHCVIALTLEYFESNFYNTALSLYDAAAFAKAGFAPIVHLQIVEIAAQEAAHVAALETVLGDAG